MRRTKEKISELFWLFRNNSVLTSSSRSFRTQSYWSFITGQCHYSGRFLQVHLSRRMCHQFTVHHQFRIDTGRSKFWATDRQYSFCLWILWTKNTRIVIRSTWKHRVLHNTCTNHGSNIKIRCIGSTSILLWKKDWSSIKHVRTLSFFTKHSQLIVSRKLFGWKLEKSYTRRYMRHLGLLQRFLWNMTGWKIWVQKLLDNQKEKLFDNLKVPNQAHQIQTQIMIERRNLLFAPQRGALHSQEIKTRSFREEAAKHDRTGKLVVGRDENHERPTVVCSEQASHPRFSREGQNLIFRGRRNKSR